MGVRTDLGAQGCIAVRDVTQPFYEPAGHDTAFFDGHDAAFSDSESRAAALVRGSWAQACIRLIIIRLSHGRGRHGAVEAELG